MENYWTNKENAKIRALNQTLRMNQMYFKDILDSYNSSKIYNPDSVFIIIIIKNKLGSL